MSRSAPHEALLLDQTPYHQFHVKMVASHERTLRRFHFQIRYFWGSLTLADHAGQPTDMHLSQHLELFKWVCLHWIELLETVILFC